MNIAFTLHRAQQVLCYGWQHAGILAKRHNKCRLYVFLDIIYCYNHFKLWSNQYLAERFWEKSKQERLTIGALYFEKGKIRDEWQRDFQENNEFLIEYTQMKYERANLREKRNKVYTKRYNAGKGLFVEYGVVIKRQHYGNGKIKIGDNVILARDIDLDYTGGLEIGDGVIISEGVKILTHAHDFYGLVKDESRFTPDGTRAYATSLKIGKNVIIGERTVIMPGVSEIGDNSIIGGNSVVTKRVPANSQVQGNPAKVIADLSRFRVYYRGEKPIFEETNA